MAASKTNLHSPVSRDVTLGALLIVLLVSAFLIVLPRLQVLRALPQHYFNLMPVATENNDQDRDGIRDDLDPRPYEHNLAKHQHAAAGN